MPKEEEKKSAEESEKDGLGPISRRVFLKDAGFVVGAPGIGSLATSALAATPVAAEGAAAGSQRVGESPRHRRLAAPFAAHSWLRRFFR